MAVTVSGGGGGERELVSDSAGAVSGLRAVVSGGERERVTLSSSATIVLGRKHVHSPHFHAPSMVRNEGPSGRLEE